MDSDLVAIVDLESSDSTRRRCVEYSKSEAVLPCARREEK